MKETCERGHVNKEDDEGMIVGMIRWTQSASGDG